MKRTRILTSLAEFLEATREEGLRMVIAFVDEGGNTQMLWREPGAWIGSNDVAVNKAWSAVAFSGPAEADGLSTSKLGELAQPGGDLYGIQNTNQGKVVIFPGGLPVYEDGKLVGGIGVSGSSVENDEKFAQVALDSYLKLSEQENNFIDSAAEADDEDEEQDEEEDDEDDAEPLDDASDQDEEEPENADDAEETEESEEDEPVEAKLTDAPADDAVVKDKEADETK